VSKYGSEFDQWIQRGVGDGLKHNNRKSNLIDAVIAFVPDRTRFINSRLVS